jgi:hypothetical protein
VAFNAVFRCFFVKTELAAKKDLDPDSRDQPGRVCFEVARVSQGWKPGTSSAGGVSHRIAEDMAFQA